MLCKLEDLISKSISLMLVPKECLITCIHIVSRTKFNKYWSLLFDLNDSHEETQVLKY